jgi:hypothetical protein
MLNKFAEMTVFTLIFFPNIEYRGTFDCSWLSYPKKSNTPITMGTFR